VTILLLALASFLLYLVVERVMLDRIRSRIPMVIAVTGTRGKSSVVRMLASILREDGRKVLAKTTGSQAQFIEPDGTVMDVPRRGLVSILEQKALLKKAARLHVDCLIAEIMSIRPENHIVESQQILRPDVVLVMNVRRDHIEAMGETEGEIAKALWNAIPAGSSAFVLEKYRQLFEPLLPTNLTAKIAAVPKGNSDSLLRILGSPGKTEFEENLDLLAAVCRSLGISDTTAAVGIQKALHDIGRFRIWTYEAGGKRIFLVNAFAANDPESTLDVMGKTREILGDKAASFTGLLNLRSDRPDRTVQWIEALNRGASSHFGSIYVSGGQATVVKRKVPACRIVPKQTPEQTTNSIASVMENEGVLFGFGNIGGEGQKLVEYWQRTGVEYGI
jgi:gamma-polyglutamate synthase